MSPQIKTKRTALAIFVSTLGAPLAGLTAPVTLAQYPAGTAYKTPIPNVIITVDTSGSMDTKDDGLKTRLDYVKAGLKTTLIDSNKYDGQFRLAWQSFACNNIPSNNGNCANKNAMGKFEGTKKTDFGTWADALKSGTATGTTNTPSHIPVWNAGEYLKITGDSSPWNAVPGTADPSPLNCRRAYHIFLTDGGWNYGTPTNSYPANPPSASGAASFSFSTKIKATDPVAKAIQNADGKDTVFPDSVAYSTASTNSQTQVYRDTYGTRTITNSKDGNAYAYPTLADMAFYHWASDLQPGISNSLTPKISKTGQETFTSGTKSVTLDEYWNPKNNPATWQHLTQYTIGYGPNASSFGKVGGASNALYTGLYCGRYNSGSAARTACNNSSTSPQWTGGTYGMYGSDFASLVVGATRWDDPTNAESDTYYDGIRPQEMLHMAINSRGKFYPVSGGDLSGVFSDIFDEIIVDTTAPVSGFTSASGSVSRIGTASYQSSYTAADLSTSNDNRWYGSVTSDSIDTAGNSTPNAAWGLVGTKNKSTADKLDEISAANLSKRLILSYDILNSAAKGISFKWANFTGSSTGSSARMWLNNGKVGSATTIAGDGKGEDRLNFIRGDRTKEIAAGGTFRNRKSRQGDIVNSAIWYVGPPSSGYSSTSYTTFAANYRERLPMIYVGGNDGMLHGFSAEDGVEKLAYVPHGAIQNLSVLADQTYSHRYYVDGSPMSGDVNIGTTTTPDWRTYLVGTLGAGGRGYFVLDITKPGSAAGKTSVANDFLESKASSIVVMDKTAAASSDAVPPSKPADPNSDNDIGHIFNAPVVSESNAQRSLQITQTNDGRWAYISGNGYNSVNERPVLLIQYLDGSQELKKIPVTSTTACPVTVNGNGLSAPQFLDVNGDGTPDFVYAGDLCGNLWKFDISHSSGNVGTNGIADSTHWGVSFSGDPLFSATYTVANSTSRQPITAPPSLRPNSIVGGLMVAFGTGRNLTEADRTDTSVQSIYSVLDNTLYEIEQDAGTSNKGKVKVKTSDPTPATVGDRSKLVAQSVTTSSGTTGAAASAGRSFWMLTTQEVTYSCTGKSSGCTVKKGWYMDLPEKGERVLTSFDFYDGSNILEVISEKPASGSADASGAEVCAPQPQAAKLYRTLINISSGSGPTPPVMDVNGDGIYSTTEVGYARMTASGKELRFGTKTQQVRKGNDGKVDKLAKLPELLLRPNWRQLK